MQVFFFFLNRNCIFDIWGGIVYKYSNVLIVLGSLSEEEGDILRKKIEYILLGL